MLATSFRNWVWPALSYINACSAFSRHRIPLVSSSRSTSLIWRSAADGDGPSDSTLPERLLTKSTTVTATTKTTTTARMTRAKLRIKDAVQVRYHPTTASNEREAKSGLNASSESRESR